MDFTPPTKQDLTTQTLYSELLDRVKIREASRSLGHAPGGFVSKTIKGIPYIYFQASLPGGEFRQVYIGKQSSDLEKLIDHYVKEKKSIEEEETYLQRLCAQLRVGGALLTEFSSGRVLSALSNAGLFHGGGVLVGTHALPVLGNLLGARWVSGAVQTQDIDIALPPIQVVVPNQLDDVPSALDRLKMGFLPVPALDPRNHSFSYKVRGQALRVDVLTPAKGKEVSPIFFPQWNTAAQPLPYLDYLLSDPVPGLVISGGAVFVKVPQPARFALHKLIVQGERWAGDSARSAKDVHQSGQVLSLLLTERPGDIGLAWEGLKAMGSSWIKKANLGMGLLEKSGFPHASELRKLFV